MPDGDKVHPGLPSRYQKPYQQICEGQYSDAELARDVVRAIKEDVKDYGSQVIELADRIALHMQEIPSEPLLKATIDWSEQSRMIDWLGQQTKGNHRAIDLVVRSGKQLLQELRHDMSVGDLHREMHQRYLTNIYHARFEGRIPLAPSTKSVDYETVASKLADIRPHVDRELNAIAAQLYQHKDLSRLRLSRRPAPKHSIDLHTDLSSLGL